MPKEKGKSNLTSPMNRTGANAPVLGGDLGVGLDFSKEPTEKVSGHNVYQQNVQRTVTGKKTLVTPMNPPKNVKVNE